MARGPGRRRRPQLCSGRCPAPPTHAPPPHLHRYRDHGVGTSDRGLGGQCALSSWPSARNQRVCPLGPTGNWGWGGGGGQKENGSERLFSAGTARPLPRVGFWAPAAAQMSAASFLSESTGGSGSGARTGRARTTWHFVIRLHGPAGSQSVRVILPGPGRLHLF